MTLGLGDSENLSKHVLGQKRVFFIQNADMKNPLDAVSDIIVRYVCMTIGQAKVNRFPKDDLRGR